MCRTGAGEGVEKLPGGWGGSAGVFFVGVGVVVGVGMAERGKLFMRCVAEVEGAELERRDCHVGAGDLGAERAEVGCQCRGGEGFGGVGGGVEGGGEGGGEEEEGWSLRLCEEEREEGVQEGEGVEEVGV